MYQAITTKYLGPTNVRGSRIKATAAAKSITVDYDDALNSADNHACAALNLAHQLQWGGRWYGGGSPDGAGYCFVLDTGDKRDGFTVVTVAVRS